MSFDALLKEVEALDATARRKLIAYMITLEDRRQTEYAEKLAQKIDDQTPGKWLTVEQCERELGLED
ncbi:hypothetical protein [Chthoniobacter flavus]|uniref:hypothetical protein n=1 Tax=Chthoniobacter flavus TaxID=191863 RepID=UPI0005B28696|nr:hypothetical protein [Chthoniobacter flavus]